MRWLRNSTPEIGDRGLGNTSRNGAGGDLLLHWLSTVCCVRLGTQFSDFSFVTGRWLRT